MSGLDGKVAYVTGVARGQGRAEAVALAKAGADVVGIDIAGPVPGVRYDPATPEDLAETQQLIEKEGRRAILRQGDVRDLDAQKDIVAGGSTRWEPRSSICGRWKPRTSRIPCCSWSPTRRAVSPPST